MLEANFLPDRDLLRKELPQSAGCCPAARQAPRWTSWARMFPPTVFSIWPPPCKRLRLIFITAPTAAPTQALSPCGAVRRKPVRRSHGPGKSGCPGAEDAAAERGDLHRREAERLCCKGDQGRNTPPGPCKAAPPPYGPPLGTSRRCRRNRPCGRNPVNGSLTFRRTPFLSGPAPQAPNRRPGQARSGSILSPTAPKTAIRQPAPVSG